MPAIFQTATINADIESVFDLISRIEEFPRYAEALKEVRKINHNTYRWVAQVRGITLEWVSIVTEFKRPTRLAWRSTSGFKNSGAYTLTRSPEGTLVSISIEFSFPSRLLETVMAPVTIPVARAIASGILARVKQRLDGSDRHLAIRKTPFGIARLKLKKRHAARRV